MAGIFNRNESDRIKVLWSRTPLAEAEAIAAQATALLGREVTVASALRFRQEVLGPHSRQARPYAAPRCCRPRPEPTDAAPIEGEGESRAGGEDADLDEVRDMGGRSLPEWIEWGRRRQVAADREPVFAAWCARLALAERDRGARRAVG